jgi:hypothetical protein
MMYERGGILKDLTKECVTNEWLNGQISKHYLAVLEEKEALALQKKMAAELDDQDFDLDIFKVYIVNRE